MTTYKLRKTGIVFSIALGIILTTAAICLTISVIWPGNDLKLAALLSSNWLITIFKLQSHLINNQDSLLGINLYDIGIILLFIFVCLALFEKFKYQLKVWFLLSISLLALGLVIFIVTNLAGRSAFMASGLIISSLLLTNNIQSKIPGITGIIANILLLVADFTVGANIKIIPFLLGLGYLLLIIWMFMIARILTLTEKG
jgi:hypothetical protein